MHQWERETSGRFHRISTQIYQDSEVSVHTDTMDPESARNLNESNSL